MEADGKAVATKEVKAGTMAGEMKTAKDGLVRVKRSTDAELSKSQLLSWREYKVRPCSSMLNLRTTLHGLTRLDVNSSQLRTTGKMIEATT